MKKLFALLLVMAAMMMTLCACGNSRARSALAEFGITDRDTQDLLIEAAREMEDTSSSQSKSENQMDKIYAESCKLYGSQLEGKWVRVNDYDFYKAKLTIDERASFDLTTFADSSCTYNGSSNYTWLVENGKILLGTGMEYGEAQRRNVKEVEITKYFDFDMLRVTGERDTDFFIRADQAEALYDAMFLEVELNNENVHDYYEIISVHQERLDSFGDKTGKMRDMMYLCNTAHKQGLVCVGYQDVQIEVSCPRFDYIKHGYFTYMNAFTNIYYDPYYYELTEIYDNTYGTEILGDISPEQLTIGRAKGTVKYLRPEFIDSNNPETDDRNVYDLFGNRYSTRAMVPSENY